MKKIIILALIVLIIMFTVVALTSNEAESSIQSDDIIESTNNSFADVSVITDITDITDIKPPEEDKENVEQQEQDKIVEDTVKKEDRLVDTQKPMVALTFDDGPHPEYTIQILDALKKHKAKATFFIVGNRAERFKSTVEKIAQYGNQIGNHTYDHKELTKLSSEQIKNEVGKTSGILQHISSIKPGILRPTYGSINSKVKLHAGAPLVLWSIDTLDWKTKNKDKIVNEVLGTVKDGDVVLMHDIYKTTAEAAEIIIEELSIRGYQLVSIDELYAARDIELENGKVYSNAYKYGNAKK